ncbi:MAG TPA: tyrosine-type recombinase/integrase [Drouetiella sp.]|jgi:integrase
MKKLPNRSKPVKRLKDSGAREREFLTDEEVERVIAAARRHEAFGLRNATMISFAYKHSLRATELLDLQWEQVNFDSKTVTVKRVKRGAEAQNLEVVLDDDEINALLQLKEINNGLKRSTFVFVGPRGSLFVDSFELVVKKAGESAKIGFPVHSHMLRHAGEVSGG